MESQLKQMGNRIREIRTILEISVEEMAQVTGLSEAEYLKHEEGLVDSSFTFIYHCAKRFDVDISSLVTGETPKLSAFEVVRGGNGLAIKRRAGFEYRHLAARLKNRYAEPFLVTAPVQQDNDIISLSTHGGQEFDYILSGKLKFQHDDHVQILEPGDSVCYDSSHPHGMVAVGDTPCEFLAIVLKGEQDEAAEVKPITNAAHPVTGTHLLYQKYMNETLDEKGHLKDVSFNIPENFNFAFDVLDALEEKIPEKRCMMWLSNTHEEREFTFKQMAEESRRTANYLTSLGIKKGDRVMLVLRRHYQFWFVITALHRIGAVAIPASNLLTKKDFEYRFQTANVSAIICSGTGEIADHVEAALPACPGVTLKISVNGTTRPGWHDFNAEYGAFGTEFTRDPSLRVTDTALMFFSSGTTGYPKVVSHSGSYPIGHIVTARWWQNVNPDGLHLTISDTGWGKALWGKIYGQWLCEAAVFVYDFDKFDGADILQLFSKYHITTFCAPPTMYRFFIREDLSKYDLSSLEYCAIAGEALNPEVYQQFFKATGVKLMEGFGQTESTLLIANLIGMEPKPGSMGKPSPQFNVDLLDSEGKSVKTGEVGEIVVRAEQGKVCGLFQGYTLDEEKNAEAWHDGIYHTGDTAWRDEDGYFWYVGRVDDLIKSSGYRIGPFEIESVLMELPYILECAVVGVPDPTRGQVVKASIVLTKGTEGTEELKKEIQNYVKEHTAPYKYPRIIEFLDAMPKTISGKIRRTELRQKNNAAK